MGSSESEQRFLGPKHACHHGWWKRRRTGLSLEIWMLLITSKGVQGQRQTRTEGTGFYMGERGRSEHQGPVGTGEWSGGGGQPTRGTNWETRVGHCSKLGPVGIGRGENTENGGWTGMEQLYKPVELRTLPCVCRGLWEGDASDPKFRGEFFIPCFGLPRAEALQLWCRPLGLQDYPVGLVVHQV